jgi:phage gpG-like protein
MADFLNITVEGLPPLIVALDSLTESFTDLRPAWPAVNEVVEAEFSERFATEGRGEWAGLSEGYALKKAARYGQQKILHASGALEASLTERGAPNAIYEETPDSFTRGSSLPYAMAHQRGVSERNLVARVIIDATESLGHKVGEVLINKMTEHARNLGLAP